MPDPLDFVCGLAAPIAQWSAQIDDAGGYPFVESIRAGALRIAPNAWCDVAHFSATAFTSATAGGLKIWETSDGIWFEAALPVTMAAADIRARVWRRRIHPSVDIANIQWTNDSGQDARTVIGGTVQSISLVDRPIYPTACWLASTGVADLVPYQRAMAARWMASRHKSARRKPEPFSASLLARLAASDLRKHPAMHAMREKT